jgi:hypothetical protein
VLAAGLFLGIGIAAAPVLRGRVAGAVGIGVVAVALTAPAAYALSTVRTPHTGAIPTAGPAVARNGFGGPGGGGGVRNFGGGNGGALPNLGNGNAFPNFGGGNGFPGFGGANGGGFPAGGFPGGARGGIGGLLNGSEPGPAVTALLTHSSGYRWTAAAVGANNAAGYQLASGQAIMAIGGFNGTDPTPTLAQFQAYVREHAVHYFIGSGGGFGGGPGGGGSSTSSQISQWVASNFTAQTVNGVTIYDLSGG